MNSSEEPVCLISSPIYPILQTQSTGFKGRERITSSHSILNSFFCIHEENFMEGGCLDKFSLDRPLECCECKKNIAVRYTEIEPGSITHTHMCEDCPELQRRLFGTSPQELVANQAGQAGLVCGHCGTTLEEVRRGHRLGCGECYSVFEAALIQELLATNRMPKKTSHKRRSLPLHKGRSPGEALSMSSSSRILSLNETLKEMLHREEYEQAAWLRDQIKALTEESKKEESPPHV